MTNPHHHSGGISSSSATTGANTNSSFLDAAGNTTSSLVQRSPTSPSSRQFPSSTITSAMSTVNVNHHDEDDDMHDEDEDRHSHHRGNHNSVISPQDYAPPPLYSIAPLTRNNVGGISGGKEDTSNNTNNNNNNNNRKRNSYQHQPSWSLRSLLLCCYPLRFFRSTPSSSPPSARSNTKSKFNPLGYISAYKIQVSIICCSIVAEAFVHGTISPFLYFMVRDFAVGPDHLIGYYAGLLSTAFWTANLVTTMAWGRLSDRCGRKMVLMFSLAMLAISMIVLGLASNYHQALIALIVQGACTGILPTSKCAIGELARRQSTLSAMDAAIAQQEKCKRDGYDCNKSDTGSNNDGEVDNDDDQEEDDDQKEENEDEDMENEKTEGEQEIRAAISGAGVRSASPLSSCIRQKKEFGPKKSFKRRRRQQQQQGQSSSSVAVKAEEDHAAAGYSAIVVSLALGASLGPLGGGSLTNKLIPGFEHYPYFAPCFVAAVICWTMFVLLALVMKETHPRWAPSLPLAKDLPDGTCSNGGGGGTGAQGALHQHRSRQSNLSQISAPPMATTTSSSSAPSSSGRAEYNEKAYGDHGYFAIGTLDDVHFPAPDSILAGGSRGSGPRSRSKPLSAGYLGGTGNSGGHARMDSGGILYSAVVSGPGARSTGKDQSLAVSLPSPSLPPPTSLSATAAAASSSPSSSSKQKHPARPHPYNLNISKATLFSSPRSLYSAVIRPASPALAMSSPSEPKKKKPTSSGSLFSFLHLSKLRPRKNSSTFGSNTTPIPSPRSQSPAGLLSTPLNMSSSTPPRTPTTPKSPTATTLPSIIPTITNSSPYSPSVRLYLVLSIYSIMVLTSILTSEFCMIYTQSDLLSGGLGYSPKLLGQILTLRGILKLIFNIGIYPFLARRFGLLACLRWGILVMGLGASLGLGTFVPWIVYLNQTFGSTSATATAATVVDNKHSSVLLTLAVRSAEGVAAAGAGGSASRTTMTMLSTIDPGVVAIFLSLTFISIGDVLGYVSVLVLFDKCAVLLRKAKTDVMENDSECIIATGSSTNNNHNNNFASSTSIGLSSSISQTSAQPFVNTLNISQDGQSSSSFTSSSAITATAATADLRTSAELALPPNSNNSSSSSTFSDMKDNSRADIMTTTNNVDSSSSSSTSSTTASQSDGNGFLWSVAQVSANIMRLVGPVLSGLLWSLADRDRRANQTKINNDMNDKHSIITNNNSSNPVNDGDTAIVTNYARMLFNGPTVVFIAVGCLCFANHIQSRYLQVPMVATKSSSSSSSTPPPAISSSITALTRRRSDDNQGEDHLIQDKNGNNCNNGDHCPWAPYVAEGTGNSGMAGNAFVADPSRDGRCRGEEGVATGVALNNSNNSNSSCNNTNNTNNNKLSSLSMPAALANTLSGGGDGADTV